MAYNVKNYTEQGGEKTVIDGEIEVSGTLTVKDGATVTGITGVAAAATSAAIGGIKAATKGAGDTVEAKIDATTSKLYVPTYPLSIVADEKGEGDTVEVKRDATTSKLYVPTYNQAANIADSTAETSPTTAEFNALLAALKAAGLMAADE